MSGFETLIYEKNDGIGYVTLNRPEALNAYSIQMRDDLYAVLKAIKDDHTLLVAYRVQLALDNEGPTH